MHWLLEHALIDAKEAEAKDWSDNGKRIMLKYLLCMTEGFRHGLHETLTPEMITDTVNVIHELRKKVEDYED